MLTLDAAPTAPGRVNKQELADILDVAKPTLDALLRRYPDLPVVHRGSSGEPWQFDPAAVMEFLAAKKAEERESASKRSELLAQVALPIDEHTPGLDASLTPQQRLSLARARTAERDLAMKSGLLVPTSEVRQSLTLCFGKLQGELRAFLRQVARDHDWPDPILRRHEAEMADLQRRFIAQASLFMPDTTPDDGQLQLS